MSLLINFLITIGLFITLIIIAILLKKRDKELPQYLLSIIFFLFFLVCFYAYGEYNGITPMVAIGFITTDSIGFLIGPLLFLYIVSVYRKGGRIKPKELLHFIPAIVYSLLVSIPFLISILRDDYIFEYLKWIDDHEYILHLQAIYLLCYSLISLRLLKKYRQKLKLNYSNITSKDLQWISNILYGIIIIMVVALGSEVLFNTIYQGNFDSNQITTIAMVFVILYLAYYGTSQSTILLPDYALEKKNENTLTENKTFHHLANATEDEVAHLKLRLTALMEKEKHYQNENLTLEALALEIPTTDRKLSALLNYHLDTNFYDLINGYRIKEVQRRMADKANDKYTLLALAYESGFNSKTTFNRIFKKETGLSPSVYKKRLS